MEGTKRDRGAGGETEEELSEIVLFSETDGEWRPIEGAPTFPGLQDPCVTMMDGKVILGGVRFPVTIGEDRKAWQMEFYREGLNGGFDKVLTGPPKMKDIRFLQLPDGRILVLTRPQGERGGRGRIGFCVVDSLIQARWETIENAPSSITARRNSGSGPTRPTCSPKTRSGSSATSPNSGRMDRGVTARWSLHRSGDGAVERNRDHRRTFRLSPGESKRPDLQDVIFSGGLLRLGHGRARLFAGLSDAEAGSLDLPDPFLKFLALGAFPFGSSLPRVRLGSGSGIAFGRPNAGFPQSLPNAGLENHRPPF